MPTSIEQLFGSKVRMQILRLFLEHPEQKFYIREITRLIKAHIHSVRRELANLQNLGLIFMRDEIPKTGQTNRKYFETNQNFVLFPELRGVILKSQILLQFDFAKELQKRGDIDYLAFMGSFVGAPDAPTDLFIVGKLNRKECQHLIILFEKELGRTVNYTLMSHREYEQRKKMTDRFIYKILESNKLVLVDHLNKQ